QRHIWKIDRSTHARRRPVAGGAVRSWRGIVLVAIPRQWPVGPIVLLLEGRLRRRRIIWLRRRAIIWLRRRRIIWLRRRAIISISDNDRPPIVEPCCGTGLVCESCSRRWDRKRWERV